MDLQFVEWVQSFRSNWLDVLFSWITELGDETVFIVITGVFYWTIDKKFGYRFAMVFLGSVILNDVLKFVIARPRPFTQAGVTSVVEPTDGYSMPSGHAQNSTIEALMIHERYGTRRYVRPALTAFVLLVSFSRVYLGQHYLSDIVVGILTAGLFYLVFRYVEDRVERSLSNLLFTFIPFFVLLMVLVPEKNLWISVAGLVGGSLGYVMEQRYIKFQVQAPLLIQGLKVLLGLAVTIGIQEGLKIVLPYQLFTNDTVLLTLDFIRYMILVMWVTLGAPILFKTMFQHKAA
jgi:membrane-associated phospholipid phosphatase